MPPQEEMNRASTRKRLRAEKRLKKNQNSDKGRDFHQEVQNLPALSGNSQRTDQPRSFPSDHSPREPKQSSALSSGDFPESAPVLLGSQKHARKKIKFVYPRAHSPNDKTQRVPYTISNKKREIAPGEEQQNHVQSSPSKLTGGDSNLTDKSIDDILFPSKTNLAKAMDILHHSKQKSESNPSLHMSLPNQGKNHKHLEADSVDQKKSKAKEPRAFSKKKRKKEQKSSPESHQDDGRTGQGQLSGLSVQDAVRDKAGCRPRSNSTDGELNLPRRGLCDEHTVLESHKWNTGQYGKHQAPPRGFTNLGNTCFLNATLQCLIYLPTFCQNLIAMPPSASSPGGGFNKKTSNGQQITCMLRKLVRRAHNLDNGEFKGNAIAPRDVVKAVPTIGAGGVGGSGYKFRPGRQEDAHEFLVHLLDAIKDGELKAAGINQRQSGWREKLPVPRLDETTLVHRIFGGYLRSQVQCTSCNYQSNTYDPFMDLALEVSKKSSDSIASAFSEFTRKETLDSKNQWKCSSCKKYICAKKHLTVFRPPLSLCIQLKRFTFGSGGGGFYSGFGAMGRAGSKIAKPIEFPANLKLPLSDGRACEYVLTGIVSHVGGSASSGHYTAYVKKPGPIGGHQWYHMDDSFVEAVSETTVLKQKDAYVLFYCRKEVKLEFPSPKGSMSTIEAKEFGQKRSLARSDSMACESGKVNETLPPQDIAREKIPSLSFPNSDDPGQSVRSQKSSMGADGSKIKFPPKSSTPDSPSSSSDSDDSSRPALGLGLEPNASSTRSDTKGDPSLSSSSDSDYKDDQSSSSDSDDEEVVVDSKLNQLSLVDAAIKKSQKDSRRDAPNLRLPSASSKRVDAKVDPLSLSDSGLLGLMDRSFSDCGDDIAADPKLNEPSLVDAAIKKSQKLNRNTLTHLRLPNGCPVSLESESDPLDDYSLTSDTSKGKPLPSPGDEATCQTRLSDDKIPSSESEIESDDSSSCSDEGKSSPSPDSNALSKSLSSTPEVNEHELTEKSQKGKPEKNVVRLDKVSSAKTKVILDRGKAKGKVLVMLGLRMKAKAWKPKTLFSHKNGAEHDLLGSVGVGKWDDDADQDLDSNELQKHRTSVMQQLEKKEKNRKRKMHLDRWDEGLDAGKTKKVKLLKDEATAVDPKKNHFHRIQSSIQRMQRGRAKGIFRQSDAANKVNKGAHRRKGSVR